MKMSPKHRMIPVGTVVTYISSSKKEYDATVDAIPENPWHAYSILPTVSLSFRDERGKLVRKRRVCPYEPEKGWTSSMVYKLKTEGETS